MRVLGIDVKAMSNRQWGEVLGAAALWTVRRRA